MNVQQVKTIMREWVIANAEQYPGLRGAHLVGGITTMPADALFPAYKDVDMHLILDESSPILSPQGPFPNLLETAHEGLMLEGGYKPITEYESAEVVLANPEIAHHLTVDSILYDPEGFLAALEPQVKRDYARRQWVLARLEHERRGLQGVQNRLPMVRQRFGALGENQMLGYSFTFVTCALCIVKLRPPSTGSRTLLKMREILAEHGREELHTAVIDLFGAGNIADSVVRRLLEEGIEAFEVAAQVRRTPHFFQHKLQAHMKPYFVESCRILLDEGHPEHAMLWLMAYYVSACQVISVDGSAADQSKFAARLENFSAELGADSAEVVAARWAKAQTLHEELFALAYEIAAQNPDIVE